MGKKKSEFCFRRFGGAEGRNGRKEMDFL